MKPLVCPSCGKSEGFVAEHFVEHCTAKLDSDGNWLETIECFDSEIPDGAYLTCIVCNHHTCYEDFVSDRGE